MAEDRSTTNESQRKPRLGTIAYAMWKQKNQGRAPMVETQKSGKPETQIPGQTDSQMASQQSGRPATQEVGRPDRKSTVRRSDSRHFAPQSILEKRLKPMSAERPTMKLTYLVTLDEAELLEELKLQLRRRFKTHATKNDIVRAAIRSISRDFAKNQKSSYLARKLAGR